MHFVPLEMNLGPLAPEHPEEIIAGVVLALLVWFVMAKFVSPAFEKMYSERADKIQGEIARADKATAEAKAAKDEYTARLVEAREEAARIREDAKNQGARIVAEAREQGTQEADRLLATARAQIAAEHERALADLRSQVGGLAANLAGRIVGESLTDDERTRRTIDRFIADLENQPARDLGPDRIADPVPAKTGGADQR